MVGKPKRSGDPKSGGRNRPPAKREEKPLTLSNWLARHALTYARRGDPSALIARLRLLPRGEPLRSDEIDFIIAVLETKTWKVLNADLRRIEKERIGLRVEELTTEEGLSQKAAIGIVQDEHRSQGGRKPSVRHVQRGIAAYEASKRRRRDAKT